MRAGGATSGERVLLPLAAHRTRALSLVPFAALQLVALHAVGGPAGSLGTFLQVGNDGRSGASFVRHAHLAAPLALGHLHARRAILQVPAVGEQLARARSRLVRVLRICEL